MGRVAGGDGVGIGNGVSMIGGGSSGEIAGVTSKGGVSLAVGDIKPRLEVSNSRLVALRSFCSLFLSFSLCFFSSFVLPGASVFKAVGAAVFTLIGTIAGISKRRIIGRSRGRKKKKAPSVSVCRSSVFYVRGGWR
ncbi:hypothetical protein B0H11DRAFT_2061898 [Mycena galericulata]|nr:hypothetical protein B0H11DRAFT_2061898 [Mycena galericulata]